MLKPFLAAFATAALLLAALPAEAFELRWYGQAAVRIATADGKVVLIDPFITGNPKTPEELKDLSQLGPVDLILVTHAHADHVGDTVEIAKATGAKVAMNADLGQTFAALELLPMDQLIRFNKAGSITPVEGVTVTMVHAEHSSELVQKDPVTGKTAVFPGGEPAGYIIEVDGGYRIYHAGDTGIFGDMTLIGAYYKPDLSLLPIGGHFTMGPAEAAYATTELLRVERVLPIHYGTIALLKGTPEEFQAALGDAKVEVIVMTPGEERSF